MAVALNKVLAEFLGTFLLVLTIALNTSPVFTVLSIAAVLMVCIYAMGPVSGGHFNPAVTLAIALLKSIDVPSAVAYVVAQVAGAQLARYLAFVIYDRSFNLVPAYASGVFVGPCVAEMAYTFMLVYVVLNVACRKEPNQAFGLAIGGVIVAGGYGAGRTLALVLVLLLPLAPVLATVQALVRADKDMRGAGLPCFLGEILGSVLAWSIFKYGVYRDGQTVTARAQQTSEFIGTCMLVLTVRFNVMMGSPAGALSIGFSLACMIFADGGVSGGNFNPAVTLALVLRGAKIDSPAGYVACQLVGAVFAGTVSSAIFGPGQSSIPAQPGLMVGFEEFVYTFVLCFVVLGVASVSNPASSVFNGLTVGLCVVAGGNAATHSGGHLNPAVTVGLVGADDVTTIGEHALPLLFYVAMQLLAGVTASVFFRAIFRDEFKASAREYRILPEDAS